jgi:hypothetical protein
MAFGPDSSPVRHDSALPWALPARFRLPPGANNGYALVTCLSLEPSVDQAEIRARIEVLKQDHRDLDAAIDALAQLPQADMIQLQRFKKRKLRLKDEISMLEDLLIPDIIA